MSSVEIFEEISEVPLVEQQNKVDSSPANINEIRNPFDNYNPLDLIPFFVDIVRLTSSVVQNGSNEFIDAVQTSINKNQASLYGKSFLFPSSKNSPVTSLNRIFDKLRISNSLLLLLPSIPIDENTLSGNGTFSFSKFTFVLYEFSVFSSYGGKRKDSSNINSNNALNFTSSFDSGNVFSIETNTGFFSFFLFTVVFFLKCY
jgi:hypothetical protein